MTQLEELHAALWSMLVNRLVGRYRASREDAEDATSYAFMQLALGKGGDHLLGSEPDAYRWLYAVARHRLIDIRRKGYNQHEVSSETIFDEGEYDDRPRHDISFVLEWIAEQNPDHALAIMGWLLGLSFKELGLSEGSFYGHCYRGRKEIQELLAA